MWLLLIIFSLKRNTFHKNIILFCFFFLFAKLLSLFYLFLYHTTISVLLYIISTLRIYVYRIVIEKLRTGFISSIYSEQLCLKKNLLNLTIVKSYLYNMFILLHYLFIRNLKSWSIFITFMRFIWDSFSFVQYNVILFV